MSLNIPFSCRARQRGFTLVEAVVVIVITGILSGMVALFIRLPVQNYLDSTNRAQLTDAADLALRRMARDLRLALPNSIRVSTVAGIPAVELLLMKTGGRYLDPSDPGAGDFLLFPDPANGITAAAAAADVAFDVVGPMPTGRQQIAVGDSIVVNNIGGGTVPVDAYNCGAACNRTLIAGVNGNNLALPANPFAAQNPAMPSPGKRFHVISTPLSYVCSGTAAGGSGLLTRFWGYPISVAQNNPPSGAGMQSAILADHVVACAFDYTNLANVRSGLVGLTLTLEAPGNPPERITLSQQIHVDNTP